ncbi:MAG: hypothetical protein Q8P50_12260 [Bacillota bacterium]|nr:hypothetical protein [Bacillota bacterium]
MFKMIEERTKSGRVETLWRLARQFAVLIATAALFGSLYLAFLISE